MYSEIRIITKLTSDVLIAIDSYFDEIYKHIELDTDALNAIQTIDGATPYIVDGKPLRVFHSKFDEDISLKELSSGTKSILLIMHRLKSNLVSYTPSLNSMGPNAKSFALHYLEDKLEAGYQLPCMFYCTDASLPIQDYEFKCCDVNGNYKCFITIVTGLEVNT